MALPVDSWLVPSNLRHPIVRNCDTLQRPAPDAPKGNSLDGLCRHVETYLLEGIVPCGTAKNAGDAAQHTAMDGTVGNANSQLRQTALFPESDSASLKCD